MYVFQFILIATKQYNRGVKHNFDQSEKTE